MAPAMTALRRALESLDNIEKKIEEGVEQFLDFLEEYINDNSTMNKDQAETLMGDIVQWHEDAPHPHAQNFIVVATYINSCR